MIDLLCALDTLHGRIRHGKLHQFTFAGGGASARLVERTLRKYGIPNYGRRSLPKDGRSCSVPMTQAKFAEYLLCSARVPLTTPLLDARNASYKPPKSAWGVGVRNPSIVAQIARLLGV
jgi:hypothetical protein